MFGKLFGFGKKKPAQESYVVAQINDRVSPEDREKLYGDPLDRLLRQHEAGEVSGGGTMMSAEKEIEYVDVEILLTIPPVTILDVIRKALEDCGAPRGSKLHIEAEDDREIPFGVNEGLAVYLNGTDLPADVYSSCDSNLVISEFQRLLGDEGVYRNFWQGPRETALYMVGSSFETMKQRLQPFLDSYPLCRKARVVRTA
jgi:hypothetical protein